jgi:hypothetical protein
MLRINGSHLQALCAWELTVTTTLVVLILAMRPNHMWSRNDLVFFSYEAVCGIFVTAAIAFFSRPFGKVGAVVAGLLWGITLNVLMAGWVLMARPGFEESAETAGRCGRGTSDFAQN